MDLALAFIAFSVLFVAWVCALLALRLARRELASLRGEVGRVAMSRPGDSDEPDA